MASEFCLKVAVPSKGYQPSIGRGGGKVSLISNLNFLWPQFWLVAQILFFLRHLTVFFQLYLLTTTYTRTTTWLSFRELIFAAFLLLPKPVKVDGSHAISWGQTNNGVLVQGRMEDAIDEGLSQKTACWYPLLIYSSLCLYLKRYSMGKIYILSKSLGILHSGTLECTSYLRSEWSVLIYPCGGNTS